MALVERYGLGALDTLGSCRLPPPRHLGAGWIIEHLVVIVWCLQSSSLWELPRTPSVLFCAHPAGDRKRYRFN